MRRNPPLSAHMAHDDLDEIAEDLRMRLHDAPARGAEFAYKVLRAVTEGVAHTDPEGKYREQRKLTTLLMDATLKVEQSLLIMGSRTNPYDFSSPEEFLGDADLSSSTEVQSLALSKARFKTAQEARKWAREHGFETPKVDETEHEWRIRQADPSFFHEESFRSVKLRPGVRAIIGKQLSDD